MVRLVHVDGGIDGPPVAGARVMLARIGIAGDGARVHVAEIAPDGMPVVTDMDLAAPPAASPSGAPRDWPAALGVRLDDVPEGGANTVWLPFALLSEARLVMTAGCPSQRHGMLKRVNDLSFTGPCKAASPQLFPPSADTITREMRPLPE